MKNARKSLEDLADDIQRILKSKPTQVKIELERGGRNYTLSCVRQYSQNTTMQGILKEPIIAIEVSSYIAEQDTSDYAVSDVKDGHRGSKCFTLTRKQTF